MDGWEESAWLPFLGGGPREREERVGGWVGGWFVVRFTLHTRKVSSFASVCGPSFSCLVLYTSARREREKRRRGEGEKGKVGGGGGVENRVRFEEGQRKGSCVVHASRINSYVRWAE